MVKASTSNGHATATQVARPGSAEVTEKAQRRRFTAEYKVDILRRTDAFEMGSGELGELLRREGLYSSHLLVWRKQRDRGALEGLEPKTRLEHFLAVIRTRRIDTGIGRDLNRSREAPVLREVRLHCGTKLGLAVVREVIRRRGFWGQEGATSAAVALSRLLRRIRF